MQKKDRRLDVRGGSNSKRSSSIDKLHIEYSCGLKAYAKWSESLKLELAKYEFIAES